MVVRLRPSTGLLLLCSLLALISLSNSLLDEENLDILHEYLQGGIEQAAKKKTQLMTELMLAEYSQEKEIQNLYPILQQLIAATENSSSLGELKDVIINFIVQKKTKMAEIKKAFEKEIEDIWAVIEIQEYDYDEL